MEKIKVELLELNGLTSAIKAVGMPYKKDGTIELLTKVGKHYKHESVLEHITFSWLIDGSSRLELQEHMRHRVASATVTSSRYTIKDYANEILSMNNNFMVHGVDHKRLKNFVDQYHCLPQVLKSRQSTYTSMYDLLYEFATTYNQSGADVAKYFLLESLRTSFVWTINLRSMLNFLELRTAKAAHFEIRHIATIMRMILENTEVSCLI
jgi:thymidylate synthase (FAD)